MESHDNPMPVGRPDPQSWIDTHGDYLYRFALVRVRNPSAAEDLVQETFLAALQGSPREEGETADRRWMIGILKHKVVDYFRKAAREPLHHEPEEEAAPLGDEFGGTRAGRPEAPLWQGWPDKPDGLVERKQFWDSLAFCLDRLPPRTAQVFTLREMDELDTEEICRLLRLSQTNLGVILHRARKQLRQCLTTHYFGHPEERTST